MNARSCGGAAGPRTFTCFGTLTAAAIDVNILAVPLAIIKFSLCVRDPVEAGRVSRRRSCVVFNSALRDSSKSERLWSSIRELSPASSFPARAACDEQIHGTSAQDAHRGSKSY